MRYLLMFFWLVISLAAQAGSPQLFLDVARFRNLDKVQKGAEVEIYVTVPTQSLTYRQRAPRSFQSAATVTLEILKSDGKSAYREVITLKPPVVTDTTIGIKNPQSFLKRIVLPDGRYTLRGTVKDVYRATNGEVKVEKPLVLEAPAGPFLSDIVLLARPAAKSAGDDYFNRGGYLLTRVAGGSYVRGADKLFFYTELHQATAGQAVRVHYHLIPAGGKATEADVLVTPQEGRPTAVVGQLPLTALPEGDFTLLLEVYGGPGNKKLLAGQRASGRRSLTDYTPTEAAVPR